ncbi:hypothetical protein BFAG_00120 [Bacteroides fragilis 3_1_12]|uniref:Lipoprotein n=1 Tax=Bacteroides fragilis 3_1_12 TaxID=457424 RepID=A0ABN0BEL9_BACFG|nr:hypothetical protein BFAG_00120 [Bacteroides fragilis 3_1_12]
MRGKRYKRLPLFFFKDLFLFSCFMTTCHPNAELSMATCLSDFIYVRFCHMIANRNRFS